MKIIPKLKRVSSPDSKRTYLENYARYSSLAVQMAVIIGLGTFGGVKLDEWLKLKFPVFTVVLSLLSVFTAIYIAVRDFLKRK